VKRHPEYKGTVHTDLTVTDDDDECIEASMFSERSKNFDWQLNYVIHFMKEVGSVTELVADVWIESEGLYFNEDSPLEEYNVKLD